MNHNTEHHDQQSPNLNPQPPVPNQNPPIPAQPPAHPAYYPGYFYSTNFNQLATAQAQAHAQAYELASQAILSERRRAQAELENARLRDRGVQKELKEDAYTSTSSCSGYTTTHDGLGRQVELLNVEIKWAGHFIFSPPYRYQGFYVIQFAGNGLQLVLKEDQFARDAQLVQAFSELPGVQVRLCRTTKLTATLLRQAISERIEIVTPPFWGGWQHDSAHRFHFLVFASGRTSAATDGKISIPVPTEPMLTATMTAAVQRFSKVVELHSKSPEQWLLLLAFHTAALATLLKQLEHPFPLALCILSESATVRSGLQALFRWHGDLPLSLAFPPAIFTDELLRHKDVPLIVLDGYGSDFARANSELLGQVLTNRQVPWKNKRDLRYFPLQALPVILSSTASALTVHPDCLTVELPSEIALSVPDVTIDVTKDEYLAAFIGYTTEHINDLQHLLDDSRKWAFAIGGGGLTEKCISALGILSAIDSFVRDFHRYCGLTVPPLNEEYPDASDWLLELLEQTADKLLDCGNLATQLISVARSMLANGTLCPCPVEYDGNPSSNVVYYTDEHLGFTISAMNTVCRSLGQSRPFVLHVLSEAGLLLGKTVNNGTFLTRISTWNVFGQHKIERVYLFARNLFDELGNPLIFGGEES